MNQWAAKLKEPLRFYESFCCLRLRAEATPKEKEESGGQREESRNHMRLSELSSLAPALAHPPEMSRDGDIEGRGEGASLGQNSDRSRGKSEVFFSLGKVAQKSEKCNQLPFFDQTIFELHKQLFWLLEVGRGSRDILATRS